LTFVFSSGTSLLDYIRKWGLYWALHLCLRRPDLMWQMVGVGLMRMCLRSKNIHVMYGHGGILVDRLFSEVRTIKARQLRTRDDFICAVDIPHLAKPELDQTPVKYPRLIHATIGYTILGLTLGHVRVFLPEDCVTGSKRALRSAGWDVPSRIWTPDQLLDYLQSIPHARLRDRR
jgi:hypothetical protein